MTGDEPPYLAVGTEVSAKYRGAFCEAKVKKLARSVKCKVILKDSQIPMLVTDDKVKGVLKIGEVVELQDPDSNQTVEGTISKLTDSSMYTVVFDDGDERTLRRSQLCLKGEKHFIESETLDNLPLSHPEHFGTPVMHGKKAKRGRSAGGNDDETDETSSEDGIPKRASYKGRVQELVGKVMILDVGEKRKQQHPVLVVLPDAQPADPKKKDYILVRSFKDGKFVYAQRRELKDFTREVAIKNEDKSLKPALEKALLYYDNQDLPVNWDHDELLGTDDDEDFNEEESSDDEPSEDKDCFVAQLYKFMDDRGTPINKAPAIVNKDLNLYRLFKVVQNIGGYNKVTNQMKWRMVYSKMNLPPVNTASHQIKNAYKKYLHAFEDFYRKLGSSMGTISRPGRSRHNSGRGIIQIRGKDVKDEKDTESPSEDVKDESSTPTKEKVTPKRVTRQDVSEEAARKVTRQDVSEEAGKKITRQDGNDDATKSEVKKIPKKEEVEDVKKKVGKKEENECKKENESKKTQNKEENDVKKGKDEDGKKAKEDQEKKDEKKKKDEISGRKVIKTEEGKKEKKEDILLKKAKVVVKKEDQKIKKESDSDNDKKQSQQASDKKTTSQQGDKKISGPQTDKKATSQQAEKKISGPQSDKLPTSQTGEKKVPGPPADKKPAAEKKIVSAGEKTNPPSKSDGDDKASPKKLARRRSMRKEDGKEEPGVAKKVILQKEVKVNLGKKDIKQEIVKKIKKPKVEGQPEEKDKKGVNQKDARNCPLGTRLKVKYGGGKTEKIYDAKVVESQDDGSGLKYLVHYAGWNNRYDEWIQPERIVSIVERPSAEVVAKKMEKKIKENASPKTQQKITSPPFTPQQQLNKKRGRSGPSESPSSSPARSDRSPASVDKKKSRPTRSNSVEHKVLEGLQDISRKPKRTRRNSGLTESSDIISHASFTDDTDNSDEETDKAEDLESFESQSVAPTTPVVETEGAGTSDSEDKASMDVVEVNVLVETAAVADPVPSDVKDPPEDVKPVIEEPVQASDENADSKPVEQTIQNKEEEEISQVTAVQEEENVEMKCQDDSSSVESREDNENSDWSKLSDEDSKPRGRPRKTPNKMEVKKDQTLKDKKEVKKTKMTMAERKYMGQYPVCSEIEPPIKKMKEDEEVKDTNDEDTEEDDDLEKKKVKKKTKKKDTDSDSNDTVKKDTKSVKGNRSKKRLKDSDDLDKRSKDSDDLDKSMKDSNDLDKRSKDSEDIDNRLKDSDDLDKKSLISEDDSSIASEKCATDNNASELTVNSVLEYKSETIEISEQTDITPTNFVNTPPTSPEQDADTCVNQPHSTESPKNTDQNPLEYAGPAGNTSPSSNDGSIGSGNVAGSDSSEQLGKRKKESEENVPAKKKKRGKSKSSIDKKSKPHGSDSDENINFNSGSSSPSKSRPRSPRTPKYNLNLDEGKYLEGEQRIAFLMDKAQEIRKIYMDLKAEVALIDRRRKRAKRKGRESGNVAENVA